MDNIKTYSRSRLTRRSASIIAVVSLLIALLLSIPFLTNPGLINRAIQYVRFSWQDLGITPPPADASICGNYVPEQSPTWDEFVASAPLSASGVAVSVLMGDMLTVGAYTYSVPADSPLSTSFHMWYPKTEQNTSTLNVRLIALIDEQQLSDVFTSSYPTFLSSGAYADLRLEPDANLEINFALPQLNGGIHDLIILALFSIDSEPSDRGMIPYTGMRFTMIAGTDDGSDNRIYETLPTVEYLGGADGSGFPLLLSLTSEEPATWNWPETTLPVDKTRETLPFYLWNGNYIVTETLTDGAQRRPSPHNQPMALLSLLDYQLVNPYIAKPTQYVIISSDSKSTVIQNTLNIPSETGRHDLVTIRINYPGMPMCLLYGSAENPKFAYDIDIQRVSITVN